jgi:hypothetical protein
MVVVFRSIHMKTETSVEDLLCIYLLLLTFHILIISKSTGWLVINFVGMMFVRSLYKNDLFYLDLVKKYDCHWQFLVLNVWNFTLIRYKKNILFRKIYSFLCSIQTNTDTVEQFLFLLLHAVCLAEKQQNNHDLPRHMVKLNIVIASSFHTKITSSVV